MLRFVRRLKRLPVLALLAAALVLAGVSAISPGTAAAQDIIGVPGATLYENPNFSGLSQVLEVGDFACLADPLFNFDNLTQSIEVRPGTKVVLFTECDFLGKSESFTEHDSDLNDNQALKGSGGAQGGGSPVSVSSIRVIEDTESLGAEHVQLLNLIIQGFVNLNLRLDTLEAQLGAHDTNIDGDLAAHDTSIDGDLVAHDLNIDGDLVAHNTNIDGDLAAHDANLAANTSTLLADAANNTSALLAAGTANKAALLADAAANTNTLLADAATNTATLLADALANTSALLADAAANHATPDPFEVTVQTCIDLGAEAGLAGKLGVEGGGHIEGSLGIDAYGNGASIEVKIPLKGGLEGSLEGKLGISTTACYEGVRVLFVGEHNAVDNALITAYEGVGLGLQGGLVATTAAIGLGVNALTAGVEAIKLLADPNSGFSLTDPSTLLSPTGPFAGLLATLPMSSQLDFDIDAALTAILNPCQTGGVIRSLGTDAAAICDSVDTAAADTLALIQGIPTLVSDLFTGAATLAKDGTNTAIGGVNEAIGLINNPVITGINSGVSVVCNTINATISGVKGFSLGPLGIPATRLVNPVILFGGLNITILGIGIVVPALVTPVVDLPAFNILPAITPFSFLSTIPCPPAIPAIPLIPLIP